MVNTRIIELRKKLNLTQDEFAKKIGLSRNFIWMIEKGDRIPSDRTISDICRTFGVDEIWLRDGIGEPFREKSDEERIAEVLGGVLAGSEQSKARLIRAVANLPDELTDAAIEIVRQIAESLQE
jgi:transcriptional regulator with XRE-family HTH domain